MAYANYDDDDDHLSPLSWGLTVGAFKKFLKKNHPLANFQYNCEMDTGSNSISVNSLSVFNFVGDCGAVYLCGANGTSVETLSIVLKLMSLCGFSKIFATVVGKDKYISNALAVFKKAGFTVVSDGFSNRNDEKRDVVFFKRIDCEYKGY